MNAGERRKKRLKHRKLMAEHTERRYTRHRDGVLAAKLDAAAQSLDDLLPPGATFSSGADGVVRIYMKAKRGQEDEAAADIARRLNLDPSTLEVKVG